MMELTHATGVVQAKVWSDSMPKVAGEPGEVVEVEASVDEYRGIFNFNLQRAKVVEGAFDDFLTPQPTMVFDIETIGKDFKELDTAEQEYLTENLEKNFEGTKKQKEERTGLYPLFGWIGAIGMYNPATEKGAVFYVGEEGEVEIEGFAVKAFADEKALLEGFWEAAGKYYRFVTYNGSGFDFPFLAFRSAVHRIKVPFELSGSSDKFVDLATKFRMHHRPFKLEMVCKALGIDNPKEEGVSGKEVWKLYREGKMDEIAKYVSRDVKSTSDLYEVWRKYVAGKVVV